MASDGTGRSVGDATALGAKEIPAGYFVDPFGHGGRRYWTGTKWVGKKGDSPTETQAVLTGTAPLPSGNATQTNVATGHVQPRRSANPPNEAGLQWPSEDPLPVDQTAAAASRSGPLAGLSRATWVIIGAAALSMVVVVALLNLRGAATNSETTSAQTVTPSEFQSVAGQLFPGCTITLDRAAPITETAVVDIAFAQNVAAQLWCGAVYLYRDRAGINAPGESATRDFWKGNAESNFGENFAWLTCRNMKILLPQSSTAWVEGQMRDFGC